MDRRSFLRSTALGTAALALGPGAWSRVLGAPASQRPYGPLGPPDANGIRLPAGFTSRVVAVSGQPVGATGLVWHPAPDGGATFPTPDGGWIYTSNSEVPFGGGASALRFDRTGAIVGAHRILVGTSMNCAGGPTPWGTWLSCEEHDQGLVWECDPTRLGQGVPRPALGTFSHEAAAVDPTLGHVYLTEDEPDGRFYRCAVDRPGDLSSGRLEVAVVGADGLVTWAPVPDPAGGAVEPTRTQVPESTAFDGGEGIWWHAGTVTFSTKGDNRLWRYDVATRRLRVIYDGNAQASAPLRGVDNLVIDRRGDIFVAEDGDDLQICVVTRKGVVAPVLQVVGHLQSELAGPALDPSGTRLYVSSQRGPAPGGPGITYEVRGPF